MEPKGVTRRKACKAMMVGRVLFLFGGTAVSLGAAAFSGCGAWDIPVAARSRRGTAVFGTDRDGHDAAMGPQGNNRRRLLGAAAGASFVAARRPSWSAVSDQPVKADVPPSSIDGGVTVYKTRSGLKYRVLEEGKDEERGEAKTTTPRYGQFCIISYKGYVKLPNSDKKDPFDSSTAYVHKHGLSLIHI